MKKMKQIKNLLIKTLPNVTISASLVLITLCVTDMFNEAMIFIDNKITKGGLIALCLIAIINSVFNLIIKYPLKKKAVFKITSLCFLCLCLVILYLSTVALVRPELYIFVKIIVKRVLLIFAIISIVYSVFTIYLQRKFFDFIFTEGTQNASK